MFLSGTLPIFPKTDNEAKNFTFIYRFIEIKKVFYDTFLSAIGYTL